MATLENVYHNFPHLAKQSGFNFQLHKGKVNWCDIENLDIDDIIEKRNFEILEQNLVNVTNCDLERENDFKILNRNFIKLFKLAQLGIDYLSYCEMYLDRCVVLLQEQLIASQEECELMKKEIQKRKLNNNKSRSKTLNYQCEKCAKVFISDVYLQFHEKRRHSGKNTPEHFDASPQNCSCNCSKNKSDKLSTSTQTLFLDDVTRITQEKEKTSIIKSQDLLKVEKLDHELQDLKERLEKAESKLSEKTESLKPNGCHSVDVPVQCSYMLMHLPSYFTHITKGYCEINPNGQIPVFQVCQPNSVLSCSKNSIAVNSKSQAENTSEFNCESKVLTEKRCEVLVEESVNSNIPDIIEDFQKYELGAESLEYEKENVNPKIKANCFTNLIKPLPPPRKLKKGIQRQSEPETTIAKIDPYIEEKTADSNNHLIVRSTPVKEKREETNPETFEESIESISEINMSKANSIESLERSKRPISFGSESRSFIKKIIKRDSSSIKKFNKNFKKSLNNLCNSVSSTEKEITKKDRNYQTLRMSIVEKLNNHLQQLGINSEWSGIPKKSMKQKLSAWKHQRRFLPKENPLYPVIRQDIEEKVLKKLKNNFLKKKALLKNSLSKQESINTTDPETQNVLLENELELIKSGNCFIYDIETSINSAISDTENFHKNKVKHSQATVVEEMTSSDETKNYEESNTLLFQARGGAPNNVIDEKNQKFLSNVKSDKLVTVSDIEISFSENFDRKKSLEGELIIVNGSDTENSENKNPSFSSHEEEMLKRKTKAF